VFNAHLFFLLVLPAVIQVEALQLLANPVITAILYATKESGRHNISNII
jgi:hypothetical protein